MILKNFKIPALTLSCSLTLTPYERLREPVIVRPSANSTFLKFRYAGILRFSAGAPHLRVRFAALCERPSPARTQCPSNPARTSPARACSLLS